MSFKSLTVLSDLRALRADKQKEKSQCLEIQSQLKKISALKREKEALYLRLLSLEDGDDPLRVFHPLDNEEVHDLRREFVQLREKIEAHQVIGPCGLTVLEVNSEYLAVSFTGLWKKLAENYLLTIAFEDNKFKVKGSTIPYFLNVQSLIDEQPASPNWNCVMDKIGGLISAYIQRKGELEYVKIQHGDLITSLSANDPVTVVDLTMSLQHTDGVIHNLRCDIHYDLRSNLPEDVQVETDSSLFSEELITTVKDKLLSKPLTSALFSMLDESSRGASGMSTETSLGIQQSLSEGSPDMLEGSSAASMFSSPLESHSSRLQDSASLPLGKEVLETVVE